LKSTQKSDQDLSRTVSVQELQARLTALLSPAGGDLAKTVPLTSHGKVVMVLVPWYHFQGAVRLDAELAGLPILTRTIASTEVRYRSYKLHDELQQLVRANAESLVALTMLRHREPVAAFMLWDHYELVYSNAASVLLESKTVPGSPGKASILTIVQARNRLLRLPEDFAMGVMQTPLIITKRVRVGQHVVERPILLVMPYPEIETE
jgi:hypothetical protein